MMMRTRLTVVVLMAVGCLPRPGLGQEAHRSSPQIAGGWVGISVDFTWVMTEGVTRTAAVITQVVPGSPAEAAGLLVGDTLLRLDGQAVSERTFAALPGSLRAGDLIRVTVRRSGRSRDFLVETAPRPVPFPVVTPNLQDVVVRLDTVRGAILQNLDSLRLSIAGLNIEALRVDTTVGRLGFQIRNLPYRGDQPGDWTTIYRMLDPPHDSTMFASGAFWPQAFFTAPDPGLPFEALVVRTPAADSLRSQVTRLRQELTQVRRQQLSRQRELQASLRESAEEAIQRDHRLGELRTREEALVAEQERLTQRLRRVSEEEFQHQWVEAQSRYDEAFSRILESRAEAQRRLSEQRGETAASRATGAYAYPRGSTGSPVIVGQSVMLGAHMAPLNPDLAAVFAVPEGVFVIQVPAGTPASDAGLAGGDIIVRVGEDNVASLSDLRFGLGTRGGPIRIRVIRRGEPVEIVVRR
jgi:S1-C subfamily serine protease